MGHPTEVPLPTDRTEGLALNLLDFIGEGSMFMFDVLEFDKSWLSLHVNDWDTSESFKEMKDFTKYLKTTNECAERGIKLISDYAHSLTKNDKEKEDLLQVVQAHRHFHPHLASKASFYNIETDIFTV